MRPAGPIPTVILDTNVVLDWLLFDDTRVKPLAAALASGRLRWRRSEAMAQELARVLAYPAIAPWLSAQGITPADILARAANHAVLTAAGAPAPLTLRCADPDDQCYIDLALAHPGCQLLSRDKAVLALRKRASASNIQILTPAEWAIEAARSAAATQSDSIRPR